MYQLQSCLVAFAFGYLHPWIPYFYQSFNHKWPELSASVLMYDNISRSLYHRNFVNPHSQWFLIVNFIDPRNLQGNYDFIQWIPMPLILHIVWIFCINVIVIVLSRQNNKISSHKKHFLQVLLILYINFLFGNPKMQSPNGVLSLICLIQLFLYVEFTSYAIFFSLAPL